MSTEHEQEYPDVKAEFFTYESSGQLRPGSAEVLSKLHGPALTKAPAEVIAASVARTLSRPEVLGRWGDPGFGSDPEKVRHADPIVRVINRYLGHSPEGRQRAADLTRLWGASLAVHAGDPGRLAAEVVKRLKALTPRPSPEPAAPNIDPGRKLLAR